MDHHLRALILHSFIQKSTVLSSSFIQTVLSAPESHRIMPFGSRALPPVGNLTLPCRFLFLYTNTLSVICKAEIFLLPVAVQALLFTLFAVTWSKCIPFHFTINPFHNHVDNIFLFCFCEFPSFRNMMPFF